MNVVDSSGWLEYFADGSNANFFTPPILDTENLIVPTLSLYEVFRRVLQQRNESDALRATALMRQARTINLTPMLATAAAKISHENRIPMADSVMLATARAHGATLWTQDVDFEGLEGVQYVER